MKLLHLSFASVAFLSACSTVTGQIPPASPALAAGEAADTAWIEENGPSPVARDGWVETVSGWYRSKEACLQQQRADTVGTPLSVAEECLEPVR